MKNNKLWNFIIFIPLALSIGAFILYFRYYIELRSKGTKIAELLEVSLVRYRNIAILCLAIGVFLLFVKTVIDYFRIGTYTNTRNEYVLDSISSRKTVPVNKYTLSENKIISDLLKGKVLRARFVNSKIEKRVEFKNYDSESSIIEFYDLDNTNLSTETKQVTYDSKYFKKCKRCNNVIAKDSIMCVHCGTVFKEEKVKKEKLFNPIIFAVNMIVILLCIIVALLILNKINRQVEINKTNLNIKTVETR